MGKTNIDRKPAEIVPEKDYMAMFNARNSLVTNSLNMGWQLAVMVLAPIALGVWLDRKFNTSPSYTLTAFFIAVLAASVVIVRTFREISQSQMQKPKRRNKGTKNA